MRRVKIMASELMPLHTHTCEQCQCGEEEPCHCKCHRSSPGSGGLPSQNFMQFFRTASIGDRLP